MYLISWHSVWKTIFKPCVESESDFPLCDWDSDGCKAACREVRKEDRLKNNCSGWKGSSVLGTGSPKNNNIEANSSWKGMINDGLVIAILLLWKKWVIQKFECFEPELLREIQPVLSVVHCWPMRIRALSLPKYFPLPIDTRLPTIP